jgi:hypothetical protein
MLNISKKTKFVRSSLIDDNNETVINNKKDKDVTLVCNMSDKNFNEIILKNSMDNNINLIKFNQDGKNINKVLNNNNNTDAECNLFHSYFFQLNGIKIKSFSYTIIEKHNKKVLFELKLTSF